MQLHSLSKLVFVTLAMVSLTIVCVEGANDDAWSFGDLIMAASATVGIGFAAPIVAGFGTAGIAAGSAAAATQERSVMLLSEVPLLVYNPWE
jgi:hypothetical protein